MCPMKQHTYLKRYSIFSRFARILLHKVKNGCRKTATAKDTNVTDDPLTLKLPITPALLIHDSVKNQSRVIYKCWRNDCLLLVQAGLLHIDCGQDLY